MPRMKRSLLTLVAGVLAGALTVPATAQVAVTTQPRGWVGVSFEVQTTGRDGAVTSVNRITEVMPGSPAEAAGIRRGDILVAVNGEDWQAALGGTLRALRPGDPLRLTVERDGRKLDLRITAGNRPVEAVPVPAWTLHVTADSMAEYLYKAMDSLRIRIAQGGERGYRLTTLSGDSVSLTLTPGGRVAGFELQRLEGGPTRVWAPAEAPLAAVSGEAVLPELRAPFGFYLFRGATYDSLRAEMEALNQEIRTLRSRQAARTRELARTVRGDEARIDRSDTELRALAEEMERLSARGHALKRAMEEATHAQAAREQRIAVLRAAGEEDPREVVVAPRPLAPYVLGQNRVAGAEVVDLQPELAAYFQVSGGVLVVDVAEGTPAHAATILPGDVITAVEGQAVRDIADLRRGLAQPARETRVSVVRKGKTLELRLRG